jgi:hypothetical protein
MSSAEPRIKHFELEVAPFQFRLAIRSGESVLLGYHPVEGEKLRTIISRYAGYERRCDNLLESLHWLIEANGILATPENTPDDAFSPQAMRSPSLNVMIVYSDGRQWKSTYALTAVPQNVGAFVEQVKYLAVHELDKPQEPASEAD